MLHRRDLVLGGIAIAAARGADYPGREWKRSDPAAEGLDPAKLDAAIRFLAGKSGKDRVSELVIVRHGRVVWAGENAHKVHGVWSMTKSFTSTVLGLLVDSRKAALDTPAHYFVKALARDYPKLTLRHFATMTSGYRAAGDEPKGEYKHGPSETPLVPSEPMFPPGAEFLYWDSAMNQFGNVLTRIAGEPMSELFRRRIAEPVRMNPDEWRWGDIGVHDGLKVNGGAGNYGMLDISAYEAARLGWLYLNEGRWAGKRLLSRGWVKQATAPQVRVPDHPETPLSGAGVYGYNWWPNGLHPDGKRKWPGATPGTFAAVGHNNNRLFVVPEWNMVVARLGLDQGDTVMKDETFGEFLRLVGEALRR